jgi:hypothetical protein
MGRPLLALALVAAALASLPAAPAQASCAMRDPRSVLEGVDAAFVGTYVEQRGPHWVFAAEQVVKGTLGPEVLVLAPAEPGTSIDLRPVPGRRIGLGLRWAPAGWYTNGCNEMDPGALLATGGRQCDPPGVVSVRRLSAARAGRPVRLGVRIAGARDAVHVLQVGWGDGTSSSVTLAAGDDGAVLRHRFGPARRRTVTARVETVPFGGCGAKVLGSRAARLAFRVSRA